MADAISRIVTLEARFDDYADRLVTNESAIIQVDRKRDPGKWQEIAEAIGRLKASMRQIKDMIEFWKEILRAMLDFLKLFNDLLRN